MSKATNLICVIRKGLLLIFLVLLLAKTQFGQILCSVENTSIGSLGNISLKYKRVELGVLSNFNSTLSDNQFNGGFGLNLHLHVFQDSRGSAGIFGSLRALGYQLPKEFRGRLNQVYSNYHIEDFAQVVGVFFKPTIWQSENKYHSLFSTIHVGHAWIKSTTITKEPGRLVYGSYSTFSQLFLSFGLGYQFNPQFLPKKENIEKRQPHELAIRADVASASIEYLFSFKRLKVGPLINLGEFFTPSNTTLLRNPIGIGFEASYNFNALVFNEFATPSLSIGGYDRGTIQSNSDTYFSFTSWATIGAKREFEINHTKAFGELFAGVRYYRSDVVNPPGISKAEFHLWQNDFIPTIGFRIGMFP